MPAKSVTLSSLKPDQHNANRGTKRGREMVQKSIADLGAGRSILLDKNNRIIAGNKTVAGAIADGMKNVRIIETRGDEIIAVKRIDLDLIKDKKAKLLAIADNRTSEIGLEWDEKEIAALAKELDLSSLFDSAELDALINAQTFAEDTGDGSTLSDRFGVPPFSILDSRQGYWKERKNAWIDLGIESEVGRKGNLLSYSATANKAHAKKSKKASVAPSAEKPEDFIEPGTSIFDPVLAELLYRWFSPTGGGILDPFAGGSVRGIVASRLGRKYFGVDLRAEQVKANEEQAKKICAKHPTPQWTAGDSSSIRKIAGGKKFDFLFSCPPYADLERYSDDPKDLSTMKYESFVPAYRKIIAESCALLAPNSFAAFVVGEVRAKDGSMIGFVPDTIKAFQDAGLSLYNEAILLTAISSAAIRAAKVFNGGRKLTKVHQNVLVFIKGNPKAAMARLDKKCEFGELSEPILANESS